MGTMKSCIEKIVHSFSHVFNQSQEIYLSEIALGCLFWWVILRPAGYFE